MNKKDRRALRMQTDLFFYFAEKYPDLSDSEILDLLKCTPVGS